MDINNKRECWSDLPIDILALIEVKLFGRARICFRCTCRTWGSVPYSQLKLPISALPREAQDIPVLITSSFSNQNCLRFFHPLMNTAYDLVIPELSGAEIRLAKDGWLLMSRGEHSMFFFNPFTRQKIQLPNLDYPYSFQGVCFSSPPTSSECMVMGMNFCANRRIIRISFTRHGENEWQTKELNINLYLHPGLSNPVFHSGAFYYLGTRGNIGVFDPIKEEWRVLDKPGKPRSGLTSNTFLTQCQLHGELFSVFEFNADKSLTVYKLDNKTMSWKTVNDLGDKSMFVSRLGSLMISFKETKDLFGFGNKVFYPRFSANNGSVFYSLRTRKFHSFDISFNQQDIIYQKFCAWIVPNTIKHSDVELSWYI